MSSTNTMRFRLSAQKLWCRVSNVIDKLQFSDFMRSFFASPATVIAAIIACTMMLAAFGAGIIAPYNPYDLGSIDIAASLLPPVWVEGGSNQYLLGTDALGRDIFSTILYGSRISILIGVVSVAISMLIGVTLGIVAGYKGGLVDAAVMRIAEVQLSLPSILVALLINGIFRAIAPADMVANLTALMLMISIGLSNWVHFARTARASTLVERNQEYVYAAHVIGVSSFKIMFRHILPNVMGPLMVIATLNLAAAILTEASLSYLGVGVPPTQPSLGTLINEGSNFLFSGAWWATVFPGAALVLLVLTVNLVGDWLRDTLNPILE